MDRLLNITGGQPLKVEDWELMQDQVKKTTAAIILSLMQEPACILTGMVFTDGTTIYVSEGYVFDTDEVYYVPSVSFTKDTHKTLYVIPDFSTTENRTFHDTTTHDVYGYRRYKIVYQTTDPGTGYAYNDLSTLLSLLLEYIESSLQTNLINKMSLSFATGNSGATGFNAVSIQGNRINGYMLQAAFNATATNALLCSLPVGLRPSADMVGFFYNGSVAPGILKIKKNGDVYYISFQFYLQFVDNTLFSIPTTGGGTPAIADH